MAKLKIDMSSGILEIEGSDKIVKDIYDDFKEKLLKIENDSTYAPPQEAPKSPPKKPQVKKKLDKKTPPKRKHQGKGTYNLLDNSYFKKLKTFYDSKSPKTNMEKNVVFVYFLQQQAKEKKITKDHIYTCYKTVNQKPPSAFEQSLIDTKNRKSWIDTTSLDDIKLTHIGETFVDSDLPAKQKE